LVALLSFWFAKQKVPTYQATAAVRFEQSTQLSGLLVEVLSYSSADNIETQVTLIKSYPILEEVARRLGRLPQAAAGGAVRESKGYWAALDVISSRVKVTRVPSTSILEIMATSTNPREARDLANSVAEVFIDTTNPAMQRLQTMYSELLLERNNLALEVTDRHPRLQALDDRMREIRVEMRREVAAQIAALRTREEILNRQMGDLLQKNREVPAVELAMQRLQREAKNNDDLLALLKAKHQEALIKESEKIEEVSIVRPATEPDTPVGAEALNTVLVGALLGLSLGLVLAFVQETLDTSIGTIEDVEAYLEVPVLGVVPHIDSRETVQRVLERRPALAQMDPEALLSHALLITHFDPKSPVAEAYRTLRTNVQFARMERA